MVLDPSVLSTTILGFKVCYQRDKHREVLNLNVKEITATYMVPSATPYCNPGARPLLVSA